jgi:AcrR family transcriptional regulator
MSKPRPSPPPDERHGERRRREILAAARDVCSAEGLAGVSIERLAREVGMSKSGLAAHFASKQALQLATVESAAADFQRHVLVPPQHEEPGLPRLRAMMSAWLRYVDEIEYRGGCFFAAAANEIGSQAGPLRDLVAHYTQSWMDVLVREARTARRLGELRASVDPARLAFQLHAFVQEANLCRRLLDDRDAFARARAAVHETLAQAAMPTAARRGEAR